jgi:hypothetical protein
MQRHWLVFEAYLVRGAVCWLSTRAVVGCVLLLAGLSPVRLSAIAAFEVVALSVAVSVLETFRKREFTLLANLAIHPLALLVVFATPAILAELALSLAAVVAR